MFHVYLRLISSLAAYWRYQRWMSRAALMAAMSEGVCWTFLFLLLSVYSVFKAHLWQLFVMWGGMKVQVEFCRGYQTRLLLTEKKTWWKESYLPGTEMLTEREKCRTQRLPSATAAGSNKLEHLHGSDKSHTFVTFLQRQIWFPQAASHDPWLFSLLQIISCGNLSNLL